MERNNVNRTYQAPQSKPTEVEFEQSLLVATARLLLEVDESENMNIPDGSDEPTGDMYFEF